MIACLRARSDSSISPLGKISQEKRGQLALEPAHVSQCPVEGAQDREGDIIPRIECNRAIELLFDHGAKSYLRFAPFEHGYIAEGGSPPGVPFRFCGVGGYAADGECFRLPVEVQLLLFRSDIREADVHARKSPEHPCGILRCGQGGIIHGQSERVVSYGKLLIAAFKRRERRGRGGAEHKKKAYKHHGQHSEWKLSAV